MGPLPLLCGAGVWLQPTVSSAMPRAREAMSELSHSSAMCCVKSVLLQRYLIKPMQYPVCEERHLRYSSLPSEVLNF